MKTSAGRKRKGANFEKKKTAEAIFLLYTYIKKLKASHRRKRKKEKENETGTQWRERERERERRVSISRIELFILISYFHLWTFHTGDPYRQI